MCYAALMAAAARRARIRPRPREGRLRSFRIDGAAPFTGPVELELEPGRTVLVGKNGAGKSALLEQLQACAALALADVTEPGSVFLPGPLTFSCRFDVEGTEYQYGFTYVWGIDGEDASGPRPRRVAEWGEECRRVADNALVWEVRDSIAKTGAGAEIAIGKGRSMLSTDAPNTFPLPEAATWLEGLFARLDRLAAGVPRSAADARHPAYQFRSAARGTRKLLFSPSNGYSGSARIDSLVCAILNWHAVDKERFEEFSAIGARMGLWSRVETHLTEMKLAEPGELGWVTLDGDPLGVASDGTLRVADIIRLLTSPSPLLLIEEPETSIHPGLLSKLLAEIDSYGKGRQIIMSTHSLQVVSACNVSEIRLVTRNAGRTRATKLTGQQISDVSKYLNEDHTLGQALFAADFDE